MFIKRRVVIAVVERNLYDRQVRGRDGRVGGYGPLPCEQYRKEARDSHTSTGPRAVDGSRQALPFGCFSEGLPVFSTGIIKRSSTLRISSEIYTEFAINSTGTPIKYGFE